jgi:hypothetical protein
MSTEAGIVVLYWEFTDALTEVLAENAVGPARRGRVARAHAAVKSHPQYNEHAFCAAVETAFTQWEDLQNLGPRLPIAHSQRIPIVPALSHA